MIGVVAHQGREVERDRKPGLPMFEQELVALIRIRCTPETGELPHRPELAAVHRWMNAARERILPGTAQLPFRGKAAQIS